MSEKHFGFKEEQYSDICREFDLKWEQVKSLYGYKEKVNAPTSTVQQEPNPGA